MACLAYDQMIVDFDINCIARRDKASGERQILSRWLRISSRMIVHDDDRSAPDLQCTQDDFSRIGRGLVHSSAKHRLIMDELVSGPEEQRPEGLMSKVGHAGVQIVQDCTRVAQDRAIIQPPLEDGRNCFTNRLNNCQFRLEDAKLHKSFGRAADEASQVPSLPKQVHGKRKASCAEPMVAKESYQKPEVLAGDGSDVSLAPMPLSG